MIAKPASLRAHVVVFAGPTIDAGSIQRVLDGACEVDVRPAAGAGHVARAVLDGAAVVGLIDGQLETTPSVWHKEILWAIEQGVAVYGASAMGAIRAAECAPFGMVGVGTIFAGFASGDFSDADVMRADPRVLSEGDSGPAEAMVNVVATIGAAVAAGVLSGSDAQVLKHCAEALFYRRRSWAAIERAGTDAGLSVVGASDFEAWRIEHGTVDQLRTDAETLLERIVADLGGGVPTPVEVTNRTVFFERLLGQQRMHVAGKSGREKSPGILEELRMQPSLYLSVAREAAERRLAAHVGASSSPRASQAAIDDASDRIRGRLGLHDPADFADWLSDNELSFEDYGALVARDRLVGVGQAVSGVGSEDLLDVIRLRGLEPELRRRAVNKASALGESAAAAGRGDHADALRWFLSNRVTSHKGLSPIDSTDAEIDQLARDLGFPGRGALADAARREQRFLGLLSDPPEHGEERAESWRSD